MDGDVKSDAICLAKLVPHKAHKDKGVACCIYCDGKHTKDNVCFHSEPWDDMEEEALKKRKEQASKNLKPKEPMKTRAGYPLTPHEESCVRALKRLARKWNEHTNRMWLFSASGHLWVMLGEGNGNKEPTYIDYGGLGNGSVNPKNSVCEIDIPNDGGDW